MWKYYLVTVWNAAGLSKTYFLALIEVILLERGQREKTLVHFRQESNIEALVSLSVWFVVFQV